MEVDASFSPDGRYVLWDSRTGVYVQPFPGPGRRERVAPNGVDPVWRGDGREIAFIHDGAVWSIAVLSSGGSATFGAPRKLFEGMRRAPAAVAQSQSLAISRDGTRFFLVQGVKQPGRSLIHVMTAP